jgi:putative hemolysin
VLKLEAIGLGSIIFLAVLVVLSAFFSGSEVALLSVQRVRIQHLASIGSPGAARVARMVESPERLLPPILLGNNLVNTAAAAVATAIAIAAIKDEGSAILVATAAVTTVLLVFGETLPKTIAARYAEKVSVAVALPIQGVGWLLFPAVFLLQRTTGLLSRLLGANATGREVITEEEIKSIVTVGRDVGAVEHSEAEMIKRVLEFGDRQVREIMTPRTEIVWVERGSSLENFLTAYQENYHTRFPVYEGDQGNVVGMLSVKDVLRVMAKEPVVGETTATEVMRQAYFVPETKLLGELFGEMRGAGYQLAMVSDEYGGVAGLVTLKQLVEGIVGPVGEEGEAPEEEAVVLSENAYDLDAGMQVEEANEQLGLDLPEGGYETVAGFVLARLGHVPEHNEQFVYRNLRFRITEMKGVKVERVLVIRAPAQPQ